MSDDHESLSALLAQAEAKSREQALEAKLTPEERDIRRRFAEALWGPDVDTVGEITLTDPTTLVAMSHAYWVEGHHMASMFLLGIWMALRHESFFELVTRGVEYPGFLPPVPRGWKRHRGHVYEAMGLDEPPDRTVVEFRR